MIVKVQTRYKEDIILVLLIGTGFSFLVSLFLLQLFAGILVILYLFEKNENKRKSFDKINLFFAVFVLVRIISVFFSVDFGMSSESFYKDALFYLSLFVFSYYFKAIGPERLRIVFISYIIFAALIAIAGITAFNIGYMERATSVFLGTSSYTNQLFAALAILMFALRDLLNENKRWYLWVIAAALIFTGILLNLGRADIGAASLIVIAALSAKRLKLKPALYFIVLTAVLSSLSFYNNSTMVKTRVEQGSGTTGRSVIWESGIDKLDDRPLLGYGPRTFKKVFTEYDRLEDKLVGSWHNEYLTVTIESGFIGLTAYIIFLFSLFYYGFLSLKSVSSNRNYIYGFIAAIGGMLLSAVFSGFINNPNLSVLFCYLTGAYTSILFYKSSKNENISN
jgi:O-antigen ligase